MQWKRISQTMVTNKISTVPKNISRDFEFIGSQYPAAKLNAFAYIRTMTWIIAVESALLLVKILALVLFFIIIIFSFRSVARAFSHKVGLVSKQWPSLNGNHIKLYFSKVFKLRLVNIGLYMGHGAVYLSGLNHLFELSYVYIFRKYIPVCRITLSTSSRYFNESQTSPTIVEFNIIIQHATCFAVWTLIFIHKKGLLNTKVIVIRESPLKMVQMLWNFFGVNHTNRIIQITNIHGNVIRTNWEGKKREFNSFSFSGSSFWEFHLNR